MSSNTHHKFNLEDIATRQSQYQFIVREYTHRCRMEYSVTRALCDNCIHRIEISRGVQMKLVPNECNCCDITPHVSEQCYRCSEIKEEIVFLKNEIRRAGINYGIEVAETLEPNPLFRETIDKLVLRIQMLDQVLLRQLIDTETVNRRKAEPGNNAESTDEDNAADSDDVSVLDDISEISFDTELPENYHANLHSPTTPANVNIISMGDSDDETENDPYMFTPKNIHNENIRKIVIPNSSDPTNKMFATQNKLYVNIPQPQPEKEEKDDDDVASLIHEIVQVAVSSELDIEVGEKRKRPDSPELWLYDGTA